MTAPVAEIVRSTIRHATRMSGEGDYSWPTMRAGLERVLADLETRSPGEPSLEDLRAFIARGDRAWKSRSGPLPKSQ